MPAVLTQADWGALRSQYENQVRVHTVAGVCRALQGGQTFHANLDIKITAQYNRHCWVADEFLGLKMMASLVCPYSEGRNSDCVIVHSSALGSSTGVVVLGTD